MFDDYDNINRIEMLRYRKYLSFINTLSSINKSSSLIFTSRPFNNIKNHF